MIKAALYLVAVAAAGAAGTVVDADFDGLPARVVERAQGQYVEAVVAVDWEAWESIESIEFEVAWSRKILDEPSVRAAQEGAAPVLSLREFSDIARAVVTVPRPAKPGGVAVMRWKCVGATARTVDGKAVYGPVSLPLTRLVVRHAGGETAAAAVNLDTLLVAPAAPKAWVRLGDGAQ